MTTSTTTQLIPEFLWAQDMNIIYIKVLIDDVDPNAIKLNVTRESLQFGYIAETKTGNKSYAIEFDFRFAVKPKSLKYKVFRSLELIIEKDTNSYWPHMLSKEHKKKYKRRCGIDWNKFMDEDEAEKASKGIVDDDDGYGKFGNFGDDSSSDEDDSDDEPIDSLIDNDMKVEDIDIENVAESNVKPEEQKPEEEEEVVKAEAVVENNDDVKDESILDSKPQECSKEQVVEVSDATVEKVSDATVEKVCAEKEVCTEKVVCAEKVVCEEEAVEIDHSMITDV